MSRARKLYSAISNRSRRVDPATLEWLKRLLVRSRIELLAPPLDFTIRVTHKSDRLGFTIRNGKGVFRVPAKLAVEENEELILWFFRHVISHIHYCPYDMKTAYQLQKQAFAEVKNWDLAYLALYFFSELQIDLVYLPFTFSAVPGHITYRFREPPDGPMTVLYAAYREAFPDLVERYKLDSVVEDYGKQLVMVVTRPRPWSVKIRLIAALLNRLRNLSPRMFSERAVRKAVKNAVFPLREDVGRGGRQALSAVFGSINDEAAAKKFYEQWVKPRSGVSVSKEQLEKAMKELSQILKTGRGRREKAEAKAYGMGSGKEPVFPTSRSKPLTKIKSKDYREAVWRSAWLKARAERIIMSFSAVSEFRRPAWTILAYPDEWHVDDDLEKLDVETSLDEGPLIPEVNTLKWIEQPSTAGHIISGGYAPSAIIVLDSSVSMQSGLYNAMTAAFIAYLNAKHARGQVAVINFSTEFLSGEWDSKDEFKELILAHNLVGYTILPVHEIERLVEKAGDRTYIIIISDCGWQNIDDALKRLEKLAYKGHIVTIFHIYGWKYRDKLRMVSQNPYINMIHIDNPERDLEGILLQESLKVYGEYLS